MLLTVFSNQQQYKDIISKLIKYNIEIIQNDNYAEIIEYASRVANDVTNKITALIFPLADEALLVINTYNLELSRKYASSLDEDFRLVTIHNDLFKRWFSMSNQVIECEYIYKNVERKSSAFDLKGLSPFMRRLQESVITSITFSLEHFDVVITARQEGRISISPDVNNDTLVNIFRLLLGNDIRSIIH